MFRKITFNILGIALPTLLVIFVMQFFFYHGVFSLPLVESFQYEKLDPTQYRLSLTSLYDFYIELGNSVSQPRTFIVDFCTSAINGFVDDWLTTLENQISTAWSNINTWVIPELEYWDGNVFNLLETLMDFFLSLLQLIWFGFIFGISVVCFPFYVLGTGAISGLLAFFMTIGIIVKSFVSLFFGVYNTPVVNGNLGQLPIVIHSLVIA